MITPITATFPALNFPKEVDYPIQEDWATFSAAAELNYGILSGAWSDKSEEFKEQTNNLALELQEIGENAFNAISLNTIEDLATYSGTGLVMIKDINSGGTFISKTAIEIDPNTGSLYTVNDGTVFAKLGGGFWVRQFSGDVNVKWFGAKGDGTTDDTQNLLNAIAISGFAYAQSGEYKVTSIDKLYGLYGEGTILYGGVINYIPKTIREKDNFVIDTFTRYARVVDNWSPLFIVGDSITEGTRASDWKKDNYASIIRNAWNTRYGNTNFGFANFDTVIFDTYPSLTQYAHNVTHSGFNDMYSFQDSYFGGTAIRSSTINEYVEVSYYGKYAHLVYEQDAINGAILSISVNGVVVGTVDTKAFSSSFLSMTTTKASISMQIAVGELGNNIIRITNTENKTATLCGMIYVDDYSIISPIVFNMGRSSIALSDIPDDILDIYSGQSGKSILALGVNDDLLGKPISTFKAKVERYLKNVVRVNGSCVVCDFIFSKPSTNSYKTVLREHAYFYNMPYIDFAKLWLGDTAQNQYLNYLDADTVHPTDAGHEFIANEILRVIGLPYDKSNTPIGHINSPTLSNSWVNFGSTYEPIKFYKDKEGIVHFQGMIKDGSTTPYSTIFTLPIGYRPLKTLVFLVNSNHSFGEIEFDSNGIVRVGSTISNSFVSLSGVSFRVV